MYKTNYKAALTEAGITYEQLSAKNKGVYDDTVQVEVSISQLQKELKKAEGKDAEQIQANIDQLEEALQAMDNDLCKKVKSNERYKVQSKLLAQGRENKKLAAAQETNVNPPKKEEPKKEEPKVETTKVEKKPAAPVVKVEKVETKIEAVPTVPVVEVKVKAAKSAPVKKAGDVDDETGDDKKKKASTGEVAGWIVGGIVTVGLAWFGISIPAINKKSFSFKFRR